MRQQGLRLRGFLRGLIVFFACACFAAAFTPASARAAEGFEVIKTEKFEGVIIPREKAGEMMKAFSGIEEKETWTPDKAEVLQLEARIAAYLKKAAAKQSPNLWSKIASYKRQYFGLIRNNHRVIFTNFFCDSFQVDWKSTVVAVEDGGDCFFTVMYEINRASFSELRINGEA